MPGPILHLDPSPRTPLPHLLQQQGVEFPCGGACTCGDCRVRLIAGEIPVTDAMQQLLSAEELSAGWRLGCCASASGPVSLEVEQWLTPVLDDRLALPVEPRDGIGAVVDLGTTTIVAQAVDLRSGEILRVESALNPQLPFGADVMSRIQEETRNPGELTRCIRGFLGEVLLRTAGGSSLEEVILAGNTVMHHLFCAEPIAPLATYPFRTQALAGRTLAAAELGWSLPVSHGVQFLPNIGGFVGSDLAAGILATGLLRAAQPELLVDLGTNGEIALAAGGRILCASTAAGPAFEGGCISRGMRAAPGAIHHVQLLGRHRHCEVLAGGPARGICGSGLVDAVAVALQQGDILPSGRMANGVTSLPLRDDVALTQADIRQLQLASGAVACGISLLCRELGVHPARMHLAGAFGNYLREESARRIGLVPPSVKELHAAGNTALRGARLLLLHPRSRPSLLARISSATEHVELAALPGFQDAFADAMRFPAPAP